MAGRKHATADESQVIARHFKTENDKLRADLSSAYAELAKAKEETALITGSMAELRRERERHQLTVESLEARIAERDAEVQRLRDEVRTAEDLLQETDVARYKAETEALQKKLAAAERGLDELHRLETDFDRTLAVVERQKTTISKLVQERDAARQNADTVAGDFMRKLDAAKRDKMTALAKLSDMASEATIRDRKISEVLNDYKAMQSAAKAEHDAAIAEAKAAQAEVERLRAEVEAAKRQNHHPTFNEFALAVWRGERESFANNRPTFYRGGADYRVYVSDSTILVERIPASDQPILLPERTEAVQTTTHTNGKTAGAFILAEKPAIASKTSNGQFFSGTNDQGLRKCSWCDRELSLDEFPQMSIGQGKTVPSSWCGRCHKLRATLIQRLANKAPDWEEFDDLIESAREICPDIANREPFIGYFIAPEHRVGVEPKARYLMESNRRSIPFPKTWSYRGIPAQPKLTPAS